MSNTKKSEITLFEGWHIRRLYDKKLEMWFFSIIDIIQALTDSVNPTDYLKKLRKRDVEVGNYIGTNCPHVEMVIAGGKKRKMIAGNTEHLFRIIQSIPSKKAEPIKLWLAKVGHERIEEINDPEKALNRGRNYWQRMGRSQKWIQQRMVGQETRNKLTDYWSEHAITKTEEFAALTNIIHQEWSDVSVGQHKQLKNLKNENLRDHMTEAELIFTALAELSTREIAGDVNATGLEQNALAGKKGGGIAKRARKDYELETGKKVISGDNFLSARKTTRVGKGKRKNLLARG